MKFYLSLSTAVLAVIMPGLLLALSVSPSRCLKTLGYLVMSRRNEEVSASEIREHITIVNAFGDLCLACGSTATLCGFITILGNLEDASHLGGALSMSLLPLLYGMIVKVFMSFPITVTLNEAAEKATIIQDSTHD
ncbi:MAG: hypothetical protein HQM09_05680 [Candidatus Riflebacteria bacterium]|nr:hypothetical protein [Candidatus Riflebacteria bacterium]